MDPAPDVTKWVHIKHYRLKLGWPCSRCDRMGPYQTLRALTWSPNVSIPNNTGWNLVDPAPDVTKWFHIEHYGTKCGATFTNCDPVLLLLSRKMKRNAIGEQIQNDRFVLKKSLARQPQVLMFGLCIKQYRVLSFRRKRGLQAEQSK